MGPYRPTARVRWTLSEATRRPPGPHSRRSGDRSQDRAALDKAPPRAGPPTTAQEAPPSDQRPMVLTCGACNHQDHKNCQGTPGGPPGQECHCRQCWTRDIMAMAREALQSNDIAKIRTALAGTYALQFQTITQRRRQAARQPGIARCESCGKPVSVRRRPRPGEPVYCRRPSTCRWRAYAKRQRMVAQTQTPGQVPASAPGSPQETAPGQAIRLLAGADLSAAMRVG